ncbi:methyltransferase domain-containing protein [Virgisporangium aliadipatigenens]|uniref:methyltransferase domain-containing protein n=1 Tax=Virgisporangium aliadipatigenens TaxID=741659 RepID=UPI001943CBF1|nr:methyltransferase domain-containing protein [Virgisporangium aliadipatigenens]
MTAADLDAPHRGYPADVIPLQYHAHMLLDEPRMEAFARAVDLTVGPGTRVLDLGAGTGVLSYFAARRGAHVTAVEREPGVAETARAALREAVGDRVTLVHADAREFLPDGPVDVVLCEMLHVGLLRERQIEVVAAFKHRYLARFGGPLPRFVPEACVQAVAPVAQDFSYRGYHVPAPVFQEPFAAQPRTTPLAPPAVFQRFFYSDPLPRRCEASVAFTVEGAGVCNAVRLSTKNLLALTYDPPGSVDWLMNHLVVPLPAPVPVAAGRRLTVAFGYCPGDEIPALRDSLRVTLS